MHSIRHNADVGRTNGQRDRRTELVNTIAICVKCILTLYNK